MRLVFACWLALPLFGQVANYQSEVRPLLSKRCLACHGPDESSRQAGLRLDVREGALKRSVIVPGKSGESKLVARITDAKRPMPPTGPRLTDAEVALLKRWIDAGGEFTAHWAYQKPVRPALPTTEAGHPIDRFIRATLRTKSLAPSPAADPATLARRVALDLTGLPPEPAVAARYLSHPTPETYARYVDELLASERYGERWAKMWLDLARYADTQGYEKDSRRTIWPYRDWVIRAFNDNLPYDQFTIRQLAGDLLPDPSVDDLVATGFHRNTMTNTEGGTDDEEYRDLAIRDRIATTGQVWMGQTWGCAQCHSHKYDPLTHTEFYQLYGFFNQTVDDDHPTDRPVLKLTDSASTLVLKELPADKLRKTRIYDRGNFLTPGDEVQAGTPAFLPAMPAGAPRNRLGFAQWLVSPENPLMARVTVNRFWSRLMGRGLVETEEDFGTQGAPPSHPELLDWLAVEFQQNWDVKALLRLIVTSETYQQSSNVTPDLLRRDPQNQWYARAARFRLDAEAVRDQALATAGLLSHRLYGPPVMPWQPDGVWAVVYNGDAWKTSKGEDRYRRALYTFMRRTSAYPSMMNFDAPTGETCTIRRIRTNTPLQALTTMNDPTFMEAAQRLAMKAMEESPRDPATRLFENTLLRKPTPAELQRVQALQRAAEADLRTRPEDARKLLHFSEVLYTEDRATPLIGDARSTPREWRYVTEEPAEGWQKPGFADASWKSGPGYFGYFEKPSTGTPIRSVWDTEYLYLRITVDLPQRLPTQFKMPIRSNGAFEIWVNGTSVLSNQIYERSGHYEYELPEAGQKAFRPGANLIAIKVTRNGAAKAGQVFDAGLVASPALDLGKPAPTDASRAAWVVVANTILNLDETLTRR